MTFPFPIYSPVSSSYVEGSAISQATGTAIGDLTGNSGLAAALDGVTSQTGGAGAGSLGTVTAGYVGKNYSAAPKRVFKVVTYGSNNVGYWGTGDPSTDITLYGKNGGAPANATDGTVLGTLNITDTANESGNPRTVSNGGDLSTLWDYVWATISTSVANDLRVAEVIFTEAVPA